jgi:hypothetical protein
MVIVFYLMLLTGLGYCYFFAPRDAWNGFDRRALDVRKWGENFRLGCASMTMIIAECVASSLEKIQLTFGQVVGLGSAHL